MKSGSCDVLVTSGIQFATRNGVALLGDLYRPSQSASAPVVISIHGGGWDGGSRETHREWGSYLASNGVVLFAVDRYHFPADMPAFRGVLEDFRAAVGYVADNAQSMGVDAERICLLGDSSGAYIAALAGLTGDEALTPEQATEVQPASRKHQVKAIAGIYGVYDLVAEWSFEQIKRPFDRSAEKLFGKPLVDDRLLYFQSSPIAYATRSRNSLRVFLAWGTNDDVVDEALHSKSFCHALAQANFAVTTVEIPSAQHFWFCDPIHDDRSHSGFLAPRLLRFLKENL